MLPLPSDSPSFAQLPGFAWSLYAEIIQRLMGASLLIFLNKTDVEGCMSQDEVREVGYFSFFCRMLLTD